MPVNITDEGLEKRDGIKAKTIIFEQLSKRVLSPPSCSNPDADRRGAKASNHRPRRNPQRLEIPLSMPEMNRRCSKK